MGGEEFLLLLPGTNIQQATRCADDFRRAVAQLSFDVSGTVLRITLSAGVACYRVEDRAVDKLLKRADMAMYAAKENGRDRVAAAD